MNVYSKVLGPTFKDSRAVTHFKQLLVTGSGSCGSSLVTGFSFFLCPLRTVQTMKQRGKNNRNRTNKTKFQKIIQTLLTKLRKITTQFRTHCFAHSKYIMFGLLALLTFGAFCYLFYCEAHVGSTRRNLLLLREQLAREVAHFLSENKHFKTYSRRMIGWILSDPQFQHLRTINVTEQFHSIYSVEHFSSFLLTTKQRQNGYHSNSVLSKDANETQWLHSLLLKNATKYVYLFAPGLFSNWYPGYMSTAVKKLTDIGLDFRMIPLSTEQPSVKNAEFIKNFVINVVFCTQKRIILLGHSKGALDIVTALSLYYEELQQHVVAFISLQAPYGGTPLVHDLVHTQHRKTLFFSLVENILGGSSDSLSELTYDSRKKAINEQQYPVSYIPTVSLATSANNAKFSMLKPTIDYLSLRYEGELSDGCVAQKDAIIPGSKVVWLFDLDHFGPAYATFPGMGNYNPAALILTLIKLLEDDIEEHERKFPTERPAKEITIYHNSATGFSRILWLIYELQMQGVTEIVKTEPLALNTKFPIETVSEVVVLRRHNISLWGTGAIMDYLITCVANKTSPRYSELIPTTWTPEQWTRHFSYKYWTLTTLDRRLLASHSWWWRTYNMLTAALFSWWRREVEPILTAHLRNHRYINGDELTLTDIYLGFSLYHANKFKLFEHNRIIKNYYSRLSKRPAFDCAFNPL
jgi:triacylglycerol lipase